MRELKIGDRVVDWTDKSGVVLTGRGDSFILRYDDGVEMDFLWIEFGPTDFNEPEGTFRFEDTEYPEWPR